MSKPIIINVDKERMITSDPMHKAYTGLGTKDSVYGIHNIDDVLIFAPVDTPMDHLVSVYEEHYNEINSIPPSYRPTGEYRYLGELAKDDVTYEVHIRE